MRQCPDCEEKDRVVIAGKIFCANCGTPWQPVNIAEEAEYKKKMGLVGADPAVSNEQTASIPLAPSGAQPSTTALPANSVNASNSVASSGNISNQPNNTVNNVSPSPSVSVNTPVPAVSSTPSAANSAGSAGVMATNAKSEPSPSVQATSADQESVNQPVASSTTPPSTVVTPSTNPSSTALPASNNPAQTISPSEVPIAPSQSAISNSSASSNAEPTPSLSASEVHKIANEMANTNLKSEIGSEIPTLDAKDESVLSDAEIKEMSSDKSMTSSDSQPPTLTTSQSVPTPTVVLSPNTGSGQTSQTPLQPKTPNPTNIVNDVVAPQVSANTEPNKISPQSQPLPKDTLPSPTTAEKMTVAGVTMSRDDALKLALGEDAAVDNGTKPKSPARPTAVVMTVIGLSLMGLFLWQSNYPDISIKLASLRAGLTASVPSFVPNGWSKAQDVKTSDGGLSYELVKDGRKLKIEQQRTDWDSQAVLEQYVLARTPDYLAMQAQGLTIYMYEGNQAAWVNQGTLYTISGDHGVEQDDIIRMATSL
jgi:hypothetical protein